MYNKRLGQITNNNEFNLFAVTFQKRIPRNKINIARKAFFLQNGLLSLFYAPCTKLVQLVSAARITVAFVITTMARVFFLFSFPFLFFFLPTQRNRQQSTSQRDERRFHGTINYFDFHPISRKILSLSENSFSAHTNRPGYAFKVIINSSHLTVVLLTLLPSTWPINNLFSIFLLQAK